MGRISKRKKHLSNCGKKSAAIFKERKKQKLLVEKPHENEASTKKQMPTELSELQKLEQLLLQETEINLRAFWKSYFSQQVIASIEELVDDLGLDEMISQSNYSDVDVPFESNDERVEVSYKIKCTEKILKKINSLRKPVYTMDSKRTRYRRSAERLKWNKAGADSRKLHEFFPKLSGDREEDVEESSEDHVEESDDELDTMITEEYDERYETENVIQTIRNREEKWRTAANELFETYKKLTTSNMREAEKNLKQKIAPSDASKCLAVTRYLLLRADGTKAVQASIDTAAFVYGNAHKYSFKSRSIRKWSNEYLLNGKFTPSRRGKHSKVWTLITQDDFKGDFVQVVRGINVLQRTREKVAEEVNSELMPLYSDPPVTISPKTAGRWMKFCNFFCERKSKTYYVDGHEREDVTKYRSEYLASMAIYESQMCQFIGEDMSQEIQPQLRIGEKKIVWIVHDETIIYANDATKVVWVNKEDATTLVPKSNGSSVMISGFLCSCHGFVERDVNYNGEVKRMKSYETIRPGKNHDGYWKNEDLAAQLTKVIPLFESLHPDCQLLFAFDNSQNHHAMAPDALVVNRLNLSDGGAHVSNMRDTVYRNDEGNLIPQPMQKFGIDGNVFRRVQKGIKCILQERNLWDKLSRQVLICKYCSGNAIGPREKEYCCATRCLSMQPDFMSQRIWLQEIVEDRGHKFIFFPKYHCELNYIEMIWAYIKRLLRSECTYDFQVLLNSLDEVLQHRIPLSFIRRAESRCFRYMSGYRKGLVGPILDYAMKKYKSHRRFPDTFDKNAIENQYKSHNAKKFRQSAEVYDYKK